MSFVTGGMTAADRAVARHGGYFAVCDTACGTARKIITLPETPAFTAGDRLTVMFTDGAEALHKKMVLVINGTDYTPVVYGSNDDSLFIPRFKSGEQN